MLGGWTEPAAPGTLLPDHRRMEKAKVDILLLGDRDESYHHLPGKQDHPVEPCQ